MQNIALDHHSAPVEAEAALEVAKAAIITGAV
jgi:hypothetical protein